MNTSQRWAIFIRHQRGNRSQSEFANMLGLKSKQTIAQWESGDYDPQNMRGPTRRCLPLLARLAGLQIEELLDLIQDQTCIPLGNSARDEKLNANYIIECILRLAPDQQLYIISQVAKVLSESSKTNTYHGTMNDFFFDEFQLSVFSQLLKASLAHSGLNMKKAATIAQCDVATVAELLEGSDPSVSFDADTLDRIISKVCFKINTIDPLKINYEERHSNLGDFLNSVSPSTTNHIC